MSVSPHPVAYGKVFDWVYTPPGALRITLALAMLVITVAVAGRRIAWLVKLIRSGRPAEGRTDMIEERVKGQVVEVFGQRRLLRWSGPGIAHFFTFWGFVILGATIVEAMGALVISQDFAFPIIGHARWLGFLEDFFAVAVLRRDHLVRDQPGAQRAGPQAAQQPLLRLAHRSGVGRPRHDRARRDHAAALPRRAVQHRPLPVGHVEGAVRVLRRGEAARQRRLQPGPRDVLPARADGRDLRLHDPRRLQQAPAHRDRTAQRAHQARAGRAARAAAGDRRRGQADRLRRRREPVRGHRVRQGQDRGLHAGRAISTSPRAPSADAASRSARPGTPASRCRRSS